MDRCNTFASEAMMKHEHHDHVLWENRALLFVDIVNALNVRHILFLQGKESRSKVCEDVMVVTGMRNWIFLRWVGVPPFFGNYRCLSIILVDRVYMKNVRWRSSSSSEECTCHQLEVDDAWISMLRLEPTSTNTFSDPPFLVWTTYFHWRCVSLTSRWFR